MKNCAVFCESLGRRVGLNSFLGRKTYNIIVLTSGSLSSGANQLNRWSRSVDLAAKLISNPWPMPVWIFISSSFSTRLYNPISQWKLNPHVQFFFNLIIRKVHTLGMGSRTTPLVFPDLNMISFHRIYLFDAIKV